MSQKKQKEIDLESLTPEEKVKYEIAEELGLLDRVLKDGWNRWHYDTEKKRKNQKSKMTKSLHST